MLLYTPRNKTTQERGREGERKDTERRKEREKAGGRERKREKPCVVKSRLSGFPGHSS